MSAAIAIKRVYDPPQRADGLRVLVDRVWPRGISKEQARLAEWAREIAPSEELRRWFAHDPLRFEEFRTRYRKELAAYAEDLERLRAHASRRRVTLLYAARDERHNNAVVLAEVLRQRPPRRRPKGARQELTARDQRC
jgi:uncharacterized protein YeaO (DUF488 family)